MNSPQQVHPICNEEWWKSHVKYSKFNRQDIDIVYACFEHQSNISPKANIIFLTGLTESFVKYSEAIQFFYTKGFNVYTYDHQSQGLSGRCLYMSLSKRNNYIL
jgi:alpha-beta hydrolase superfamily lysophospholipase